MVINDTPEERREAVEFAGKMPYTFVNLQADFKFEQAFLKSADTQFSTVLLDRNGRVVYAMLPDSTESVRQTTRVLKLMLAHEAAKPSPGAK